MDAAATLYLCIEAAGCPTVCRHCWAQGSRYGAMPLADIAWVLAAASAFCASRGVEFQSYPMHEVAAHPDAAVLFRLFNEFSVTGPEGTLFEPLATTGVPLATRDDWRDVLRAAAETGTRTIWVAFHGLPEEHDRQVNRRGAFAETCLAVERARAAGLRAGCNVFLTAATVPRLSELMSTLAALPIDAEASWEIAAFLPTPRSRLGERIRPRLADLEPWAGKIAASTACWNRARWTRLAAHTEAAYVRLARAGAWPATPPRAAEISLVCRPGLDVYTGLAGAYRRRLGNLRTDGAEAVLERAVAGGPQPDDALWFGPAPLPGPADLAAGHGDATGMGLHLDAESVRYLWLDRAARATGSLCGIRA